MLHDTELRYDVSTVYDFRQLSTRAFWRAPTAKGASKETRLKTRIQYSTAKWVKVQAVTALGFLQDYVLMQFAKLHVSAGEYNFHSLNIESVDRTPMFFLYTKNQRAT